MMCASDELVIAASVGGALQNYWVGSAVWDHTGRPPKVDGRLSA